MKTVITNIQGLLLSVKELAQLLKRVDAEISNCESCHHDENEKRKKYKVRSPLIIIIVFLIYSIVMYDCILSIVHLKNKLN